MEDNYHNEFFEQVARYFATKTSITETCFVFPNKRAILFFRQMLSKYITNPIFSPKIITIEECFIELSNLQIEPTLNLILRLYSIYRNSTRNPDTLEQFIDWGKIILQDFSEIDNHLVYDVDKLFTTIHNINQIDDLASALNPNQLKAIKQFWGIVVNDNEKKEIKQRFIRNWNLLLTLYKNLQTSLLNDNMAYEGLLHKDVILHWDKIPPHKKNEFYAFVAFNALTKSEEQLMINLQNEYRASFFFDYSNNIIRSEDNRSSLFIKSNLRLFSDNMPLKDKPNNNNVPKVITFQTTSTIQQAHCLFEILNNLFPPNEIHNNYINTAIILPNEKMLVPILHAIPPQIKKINVTMGFPLSATMTFSFLKNILNLHLTKNAESFYYQSVLAVLSHPIILNKNKSEITQLIKTIKNKNLTFLSPSFFQNAKELKQLFVTLPNQPQSVIEYLYNQVFNTDSSDDGAKDVILTTLNTLLNSLKDYPIELSIQDVFALLINLLQSQSIPYTGEPLQGLQIMGVLEARALQFDNVIYINFNDDIFPGKNQSHSFIPLTLRKGFNLPTPQRQDAIFAYNFYELSLYAKKLFLIYNNVAENTCSSEPSRFLRQMKIQFNIPTTDYVISQNIVHQAQPKSSVCLPKTQKDIDYISDIIFHRGISPTWIKNYIRCPAYFYWSHIKNVIIPNDNLDIISPPELGTLFHSLMHLVYQPFVGKTINSETLLSIIDNFNTHYPNAQEMESILHDIKNQHLIIEILQHFVIHQLKSDLNQCPFTIVSLEKEYSSLITTPDNEKIILKGNIDRVDIYDNTLRIIDYKTGSVENKINDLNELFLIDDEDYNDSAFQVILYSLLVPRSSLPIKTYLYSVKQNKTGDDTAQIKIGGDPFTLHSYEKQIINGLVNVLTQLCDKQQPFEASLNKKNCEKCIYRTLCLN